MCTHVSFCVFLWEQTLTAELVNRNYPAFSKLEPCRCLHTSSKKKKKLDSPMIVFICFAGFVETQIAGPDSLFIIRRSVRGFHYRYCLQKEITSWRALSSTSSHILSVVFLLTKSSYQGKDWTVSHYWILLSIPLFIFLACLLKNVLPRITFTALCQRSVPDVSGAESSVITVLALMTSF